MLCMVTVVVHLLGTLRRDAHIVDVGKVGSAEYLVHSFQRDLQAGRVVSLYFQGGTTRKSTTAVEQARNITRLTPLVSGSQYAATAPTRLMDPKMKYVLYGSSRSISGVVLDTARLCTQCMKDASATVYARSRFVGISEAYTQAISDSQSALKGGPAIYSMMGGGMMEHAPTGPQPMLKARA